MITNPDNSFTPGQIHKLLVIAIIFTSFLNLNSKARISLLVLFIASFLNSNTIFAIIPNLIATAKIASFLLVFYFLLYSIKKNNVTLKQFISIISFSYIIIIINQILGYLGFGKSTYDFDYEGVGTTGFFFETNAYSIIFLTIASILLFQAFNNKEYFKLSLYVLLNFIIGFSIGTKVAMVGIVIVHFIILFYLSKKYFFLIACLSICFAILNFNKIMESSQVTKINKNMDYLGTNEGLFSGRLERLDKCTSDFFDKYTTFEQFFGIGDDQIKNNTQIGGIAEIDYIDILKKNGIIGFIIIYFSFISICINQLKNYKKYKIREFKIIFLLNIIFLIISSTAGHLFLSGSAPIFLALLNIYPFLLIEFKLQKEITYSGNL